MPKYTYKCTECEGYTITYHGFNKTLSECELCESTDSLQRLPSTFVLQNNKDIGQKPGAIVKEFIEDAKEQLVKQKEELTSGWNDD
tara:strand:- start:523 stop:780 length:258 start_codon:yes stop_codon:yes gene_type:complete